jgi:hypothetical protein
MRFEIDLDDMSVKSSTLADSDNGGYELPAFNHLHQGEETCYTYNSAFMF